MNDRYLSVAEICTYLGIKRDTVYKWISKKDLPAHRIEKPSKIKLAEIDEWVKKEDQYTNNKSMNENTRMMVTYNMLNSTKKHRYFKPTLKRYLATHVQSQFLNIKADEWETAIFLPVEQFVKKNKKAVWKLSRELLS